MKQKGVLVDRGKGIAVRGIGRRRLDAKVKWGREAKGAERLDEEVPERVGMKRVLLAMWMRARS